MKYGYVRVSTKEQNIDRQISAILKEGIKMQNVYIDKASGKDFNREKYKSLMRRLKTGDELYVKSIDRLGRNYDEIIQEWHCITKVKKSEIVILDFPLLDTRNKINNLTGKFLADIVLQILSYVAQIERENTRQRQVEGIREAQKKGVRFGRRRKAVPEAFHGVAIRWQNGELSLRQAGKILGVSHTLIARWLKEGHYIRE